MKYAHEVLALELAAEHLARAQLADPEVAAVELLAGHFHSSAPLRQTNTKATNSRTMNVATSPSAYVP